MPFIKSLFRSKYRWPMPPLDTRLIGQHVELRVGDPANWRDWRNIRALSKEFLVPWEPTWSSNGLSYEYFSGNLHRHWREWREGTGYAFFIFLRDDAMASMFNSAMADNSGNNEKPSAISPNRKTVSATTLIGAIALNDVQRGVSQKGTLGYWIGESYTGNGFMTEATDLVCNFAFNDLKLHRVEASCLPRNEPSRRLLKKLGFEEEGFAKEYLRINGEWEDHLLWGKVSP